MRTKSVAAKSYALCGLGMHYRRIDYRILNCSTIMGSCCQYPDFRLRYTSIQKWVQCRKSTDCTLQRKEMDNSYEKAERKSLLAVDAGLILDDRAGHM